MCFNRPFHLLCVFLLVLLLSGCAQLFQPGSALTPTGTGEKRGTGNPNAITDPSDFQAALLQALNAHNTVRLQQWMTDPFLTATWRMEQPDTASTDALKSLSSEQLSTNSQLTPVDSTDLQSLIGGVDPRSFLPGSASGASAFLVSGWGLEGRDEAILFITRQPDNTLRWRGWMRIPGGSSGARLGGVKAYQNEGLGFSMYIPKDYQVSTPTPNEVTIIAPQVQGVGEPGLVFITVEPANGRTSEQIAQQVAQDTRAAMGPAMNITVSSALNIEGAQAFVINNMPGQDINRQLFMVRDDLLYHMTFTPSTPQSGVPYRQMEDAYAIVINTFHFLK